ncbi:MAG: nicotinate (nicotinamide) nucleotide adenylyltransferase [Candidatus Sumerlaeota bacterium]|nr:nicotinate (nicotinamide) nucleotide adenylyltransferase [Candidatus Sumerlaeota bacterium]
MEQEEQGVIARRIGIFGGSFNPPHISHVLACHFALCSWPLDLIMVVPNYMHPFGKPLEPFERRYQMACLAFRHLAPWVEVSRVEEAMGGTSYTVDTVRALRKRHPDAQFHMVIGSDILNDAPRWKEFEEISETAPLLVVPRLILNAGERNSIDGQSFFLPAMASSDLRELLRLGEDPGAAIPQAVMDYIRGRGLYGYCTSD